MKNLFLLLAFTLLSQFVFAQKFSFGLKGGINANQWYFSHIPSDKKSSVSPDEYSISYELGGTISQKLTEKLVLNEEILFSQRNSKTFSPASGLKDLTVKYDFLAIPVFVSYKVYKPLSIDLGGEYSRILSSNSPFYKDLFDNLNFVSGIIGLRYNFLKHFNVHTRYVHSFNKIGDVTWLDFNATEIDKSKLRSHTFSLAIGYNF